MLIDSLRNLDYIQTGDILLFKSLHSRTSSLVKLGTRGHWTHVGIAIWEGEILKLFESSMSRKVFDELTGEERFGVRKIPLSEVLNEYAEILVRKVTLERDGEFFTRLGQFIESQKSKNYTSFLNIPFIPFLCIDDPGIHCSQLVSEYMDYMGLLDDKPGIKSRCFFNILPGEYAPDNADPEFNALFSNKPVVAIFLQSGIQNDTLLLLAGLGLLTGVLTLILIRRR